MLLSAVCGYSLPLVGALEEKMMATVVEKGVREWVS
jgi:hypothetical protein